MSEAISAESGVKVEAVRILTLRAALKLEVAGMTRRGRSVYSIVKEEFGFKGSKQKVLTQLNVYIEDVLKIPSRTAG